MRRVIRTLGWLPATLAGLLALTLLFLFTTEAGLASLWSLLRDRLPEGVSVQRVEGRLIGPLELHGVDIDQPGLQMTEDRLVLDWRPSRLAVAKVQIAQLGAEGVDIELRGPAPPPAADPDTALSLDFRAPITLVIEDAFIENFTLRSSPGAEPLVINAATMAGVWDRGSLEISELTVRSPLTGHLQAQAFALLEHNAVRIQTLNLASPDSDLSTQLQGQIRQTLGRLNLDLEGQWNALRWPLTSQPQVRSPSGRFHVEGHLAALEASLKADLLSRGRPATLQAQATVQREQIDARIAWDTLAWPLEAALGDVQLRLQSGAITAKGPVDAVRLQAQTAVLPAEFKPVELRLNGVGNPQGLTLDALRLDTAGSETRITGRVSWQPTLSARLNISGRNFDPSNLSPTLADWPGDMVAEGAIRLEREGEQIQITIPDLRVEGQLRDQPLAVALKGQLSPERVQLERLQIKALGGEIAGQARLALAQQLEGQAQLRLDQLDPAVLLPQWPGSVNGQVQVELAGTRQTPVVRVPRLQLSGELRERPVDLAGRLQYVEEGLRIEELTLESGPSELSLQGRASAQQLDLQWRISSPDLADFYPGVTGRLLGNGQLSGPTQTPRVQGELRGEALGYREFAVAGLDVAADIDLADGERMDVDLRMADAQIAATGIRSLIIDASGEAEAMVLKLETQTTEGVLKMRLAGAVDLQAPGWEGQLTELELDPVDFPAWRLESEAYLDVGATDWSVADLCLAAASGPIRRSATTQQTAAPQSTRRSQLCLEAAATDGAIKASTTIDYFDLAYITPLLPPATRLSGAVQGEAAYQRDAGREQLNADLKTSAIELIGTRGPDDPLDIAFAPGGLTIRNENGATRAQLSLPLEDDTAAGLQLDARLQGEGMLIDRPLDGQLRVELSNLDFVALLVDALTDVTGRLSADLQLTGALNAPDINGRLELADAAASIDAAGIDLREVQVLVTGDPSQALTIEAQAKSGDGQVRANARAQLGERRRIQAQVSGERFLAYNTEDARVLVTPDLQFELEDRQATLEGAVRVPSARITPQKRDSDTLVRASDDEVIIGPRARGASEEPIQLTATVDLILGDDVRFEGFGLTSRIEGQITARDRAGNQTTATGELRLVDGAYKAYGQNLDIRRGRLIFAGGPITEPGLDVKASRYPTEDIEVGVRVRGPLNRPEFELYSDPTMAQQEQLSYLVLGRSLDRRSGASGTEQAALANAALALGLRGGSFLADTLQDKVGLDEISIGAQAGASNDQASLVLGKYLSPKLYISYGVALFKPGQSFRLRYSLSDKWTLKTETGSQTGGDLIYTIERD